VNRELARTITIDLARDLGAACALARVITRDLGLDDTLGAACEAAREAAYDVASSIDTEDQKS